MILRVHRAALCDPRFPLSTAQLEEIFRRLADSLGCADMDVCLRLVDDREMSQLNQQFMGCLGPTNILSFPSDDGLSGDMALSVDTLVRETFLYNQDAHAYTVRLLAHGLLHLRGLDHGPEMDALTAQAVAIAEG